MNWERLRTLDEAVLKHVINEEEIDRHINSEFEAFPTHKHAWEFVSTWNCPCGETLPEWYFDD